MTTNTNPAADMRNPYKIAPDTWVIPELVPGGPDGGVVAVNSMVIAGAEPVIVDTGNELSRKEWTEAAFSIVDPKDVRWVFLSHDDHDHIGNLPAVMDACPNATLVTNMFTLERTARALPLPALDRIRWVNPGESFDAGDRTLVAVRPPIFDGPTTRGLFDPTTGVYWAVDTFAALHHDFVTDVSDVPHDLWSETLVFFNQLVSPWHQYVDLKKWNAVVDHVAALGATTVAAGHSAPLRGERLAEALHLVRGLPTLPDAVLPAQADLDALLAVRSTMVAAA